MKEKILFKLSFIFSLVGITILFFISENSNINPISISDIEKEEIGNTVKIIGKIERTTNLDKIIFLEVGQEKIETISVILFKDSEILLSKGDSVEIIGEIDDYNGKKEVIANSIRKI